MLCHKLTEHRCSTDIIYFQKEKKHTWLHSLEILEPKDASDLLKGSKM